MRESSEQPTSAGERLLILGASVRAAAASARRAGFVPNCADMFGDEDLRAIADSHTVTDYPRQLIDVANAVPPCRWLYTGALENSPRLIARISRRNRLLGNPPAVLRLARDPARISETLRSAGLPSLRVLQVSRIGICENSSESSSTGEFSHAELRIPRRPEGSVEWLIKPRRSGGGRGIRFWRGETKRRRSREPFYLQEYASGTPVSAIFLASRLSCRLVGITRQLVGEAELHAPRFVYCGSLGPLRLPGELTGQIEKIGRVLANECGLRGLFGIDAILRGGDVWVTEINPRYTASVEVLELATGRALIGLHVLACESFLDRADASAMEQLISQGWDRPAADEPAIVGKAVLFAPSNGDALRVPPLDGVLPEVAGPAAGVPSIADIPRCGLIVRSGEPVCTAFAAANTVAKCLNALLHRVRMLEQAIRSERSDGVVE